MTQFLYFTLGIIFIEFIFPLIEGIIALILGWLEAFKGEASLRVAKYNHTITELGDDSKTDTRVIGFSLPTEEEDEEEYYEEEEEEE